MFQLAVSYDGVMNTIRMADLKQNPARVIHMVRSTGQEYEVTSRGRPIGVKIAPVDEPEFLPPKGGLTAEEAERRRRIRRERGQVPDAAAMTRWAQEVARERALYPVYSQRPPAHMIVPNRSVPTW